jgi:glycine/D-amino acid oxidase-like deaminating enzyme
MSGSPDVLVVGAGAFGLSVARACLDAGLRVTVADRGAPGSGASGGLVGALAPHAPEEWDALKGFQLAALASLPEHVRALEAETGRATGHARTGRLQPLASEAARARAEARARAAAARWAGLAEMRVLDRVPEAASAFLPAEACPHGVAWDGLTGRIAPRALIGALAASVRARGGEIRAGWTAEAVHEHGATFDRGRIAACHVVIAAGAESFPLAAREGGGMKGQAALLAARLPEAAPVITGPGLYVVRQGPERVAVGSTAERTWAHMEPDAALDAVIAKARALSPALAEAPVVERWAGLRPRAPDGRPRLGPLPGRPRLILATGGFRIGLALAHEAGAAVAAMISRGTAEGTAARDTFLP